MVFTFVLLDPWEGLKLGSWMLGSLKWLELNIASRQVFKGSNQKIIKSQPQSQWRWGKEPWYVLCIPCMRSTSKRSCTFLAELGIGPYIVYGSSKYHGDAAQAADSNVLCLNNIEATGEARIVPIVTVHARQLTNWNDTHLISWDWLHHTGSITYSGLGWPHSLWRPRQSPSLATAADVYATSWHLCIISKF